MEKITGKIAYRAEKPLFSKVKLILTCQVCGCYQSNTDINDPKNGSDYLYWRDAQPQDLIDLFKMGVLCN
jgi:hypothetical protein